MLLFVAQDTFARERHRQ